MGNRKFCCPGTLINIAYIDGLLGDGQCCIPPGSSNPAFTQSQKDLRRAAATQGQPDDADEYISASSLSPTPTPTRTAPLESTITDASSAHSKFALVRKAAKCQPGESAIPVTAGDYQVQVSAVVSGFMASEAEEEEPVSSGGGSMVGMSYRVWVTCWVLLLMGMGLRIGMGI